MSLTVLQLSQAAGCTLERAAKWHPYLIDAMELANIHGVYETASFISQLAHESANLSVVVENLNYTADSLAKTWPARYRDAVTKKPNQLAVRLHRKPIAIANNCYANRMGNGNEASGDGWLYRGRGPIQITGKANYLKCGRFIGQDLIKNPDLLLQPKYGALSAGWFWHANNLDAHDDDISALAETKIINGGMNGLSERQHYLNVALRALHQAA